MNDLIRKIREFGDTMYTAGESETDEKHLIAGEALFEEIANMEMLMNWISVKDRLPEIPEGHNSVSVLVAEFDAVYEENHENAG